MSSTKCYRKYNSYTGKNAYLLHTSIIQATLDLCRCVISETIHCSLKALILKHNTFLTRILSIRLIVADEILFELIAFCLPVCSPTQHSSFTTQSHFRNHPLKHNMDVKQSVLNYVIVGCLNNTVNIG